MRGFVLQHLLFNFPRASPDVSRAEGISLKELDHTRKLVKNNLQVAWFYIALAANWLETAENVSA